MAPSHSRASFVQAAQGFLEGLNLHSLPVEAVPVFHHPCGKAFYLMSDWNFIWDFIWDFILTCAH